MEGMQRCVRKQVLRFAQDDSPGKCICDTAEAVLPDAKLRNGRDAAKCVRKQVLRFAQDDSVQGKCICEHG